MSKGITKHVPNHQQRALVHQQALANLIHAEDALTPEEMRQYDQLVYEAETLAPTSILDRAAILERAKAHVANAALAAREAHKTPEQHRRELFG